MADTEKIQGQDILRLFRELQKNGTLLKVYLPDSDFKPIARITDIQTRRKTTYFLIDHPETFKTVAKSSSDRPLSSPTGSLEFEFIGIDEIRYAFQTRAWQINHNKIWLELPRMVERQQRRRQFRISAPAGTALRFKLNSIPYELKVIDISLGGSLGVLAGSASHNHRDAGLSRAEYIEALELNFPSEYEGIRVTINRAEVRRLKRYPQSNRYEYALEFQEIDSINKKRLNEQIYKFQREFLRRRLRVNA
ncbi:MAG: PilZ domain-containing protein [Deltaproteobacteria bacterium]|jgi:c-di-GMP-binding flagellar brake protein YcgR|nr:PilZ domain-containing protein [Deltaproteobacteria bacterium]